MWMPTGQETVLQRLDVHFMFARVVVAIIVVEEEEPIATA